MKQASLFNLPSKEEIKDNEKKLIELIHTFSRPKIAMQGYEDMEIPSDIQSQIMIERLILAKENKKLTTLTESMWFISTASLAAPPSHSWTKIYMHLFRKYMISCKKDLPDFVKDEIVLDSLEKQDLLQLRQWLYKKSMEAIYGK